MRGLIAICIASVLLVAAPAFAQTHIPFGNTTATFQWGPPPAGVGSETDSQADHYEVNQDAGAYVNAGVALGQANYSFLIPQAWKTEGATHTLGVRLCRQTVCGAPLTASYIQDPRPPSAPGLPTNPRVVVPPGATGIAVNGVIDRPPFKEKGLDVVSIRPDDGIGTLLVGAQGLRDTSGGFVVRVGDQAGVVVWRPAPLALFHEGVEAVKP